MQLGLEPRELGAVGEDDPPDLLPVDLAVAEDALAPALAQGGLQSLVLAIETVDDVVARDHGRAVARERLQRLALAGCDPARERDRERSLHYSVGSASSEASASGASASAARLRLLGFRLGLGLRDRLLLGDRLFLGNRLGLGRRLFLDNRLLLGNRLFLGDRLGLGRRLLGLRLLLHDRRLLLDNRSFGDRLFLGGSLERLGSGNLVGEHLVGEPERGRLALLAGHRLDGHPVLDALEREREAPAIGVDLEDPDVDLVSLRDHLARILDVVLRELGDVDEPLDARQDLDEGAERDDLRHGALHDVALLVALEHLLPRVGLGLLEAERDPLALAVDVEHLNLDRLPDVEHLRRMVHVAPRKLGDVDEAVHPVEVDERAEVDDVGDRALDDVARD